MKKNRTIFMLVLVCMCLILSKTSTKAYAAGENEPQITEIQFLENGKILKTSDTLHVSLKTENVDCDTYYKCRVLFTAYVGNGVDDIAIECTYNPSSGFYQGESAPISKEEVEEAKYEASFYGFYNEHPGIYGEVLNTPVLSFVYSDNCYIGIHTGGEAQCNQLARCKICQSEYGELAPHIYNLIDNGDGTHSASCVNCNDNYVERHKFETNICACGAIKAESTLTPTPAIIEESKMVLTAKSASWVETDRTAAVVKFYSDKDGFYYVTWGKRGETPPVYDGSLADNPMYAGQEVSVTVSGLAEDSSINIYVFAKDTRNVAAEAFKVFLLRDSDRPIKEAGATPTPTTRAPYIPKVSESVVKGLEEPLAFYPGKVYSFSVIGAGIDNADPINGDIQWRPIYWSSYPEPTGSQREEIGTIGHKSGIYHAGTFDMYIFFQKYVYDRAQWQPTDVVESYTYKYTSAEILMTPTPAPTPSAMPEPIHTPDPVTNTDVTPSAPKFIKNTSTYNTITISWNTVEGADGYEVYLKGKNTVYKNVGSKTSYTFKKLTSGTNYKVGVRAYINLNSTRLRSGYTSAKITPKPVAPSVSKVRKNGNNVKISIKRSGGASGYQVYYCTSKNGKYKKIATIKGNKSTLSIKLNSKLSRKKTVYYKVRAYRNVGKKKVYSTFSKYKR